jgi:hypothetical protein
MENEAPFVQGDFGGVACCFYLVIVCFWLMMGDGGCK